MNTNSNSASTVGPRKSFAIYIPAYNAEKTISKVLDRIPKEILSACHSIFVVDNASQDKTTETVLVYKKAHQLDKLHVLTLPKNMGYGGSQKIGYRYYLNQVDVVVMLHSDGQYAPEVLPELLKPMMSGECDMIFGSRIAGAALKGGMPIHRYLGNLALTTIQNILLGSKLTEFHSGYRIFATNTLKRINFETLSDDYHFDTEMLILHLNAKARIKETPIPTYYGDEENYVNIWAYGIHILVTTGTYFLHKIGVRKSKNWSRILDQDHKQKRAEELRQLLGQAKFDLHPFEHSNQFSL